MAGTVFNTLAIVGVGLIGSSLARAARETGAARTIRLYDRDPAVRETARNLALGDVVESSAADAVTGADCVMLCVPVGRLSSVTGEIAGQLAPETILTDVGSVKASALTAMVDAAPDHALIVPGHPIAGTEKSGPDAGFATLFRDRWCILTPRPDERPEYQHAVSQLSDFWTTLGSEVQVMDPERHDLVLAITSHLPHLIAFNIVATAADMEQVTEGEVVKYSAGGFRDFTRIAASDPTMWRDVFLQNKDAVLETLGRFTEDLTALQRAIRWGDGDTLFDVFTRARGIRKSILDAGQDTDVPNFGRDEAGQS